MAAVTTSWSDPPKSGHEVGLVIPEEARSMEDAPALRQALERLPNDIRLCEEALAVRNRVRLAEGFHARPLIRFLVGLHDEREGSRPQVDARAEALLERPANALLTPSLPITRSASRCARGSGTSC
jgi:hypothetical protein